jgi:enterochelin esterase-like enzyme
VRRIAATALAAAWLVAGLAGAYTYVHRYAVYRGFPPPQTPAGIARGTTRYVRFRSRAIGGTHRYVIYLPPDYAAEAAAGRRFPVLYLLHGYPGEPRVFIDAGALAVDADVLIAHHRIPPMILVMPAGKHSLFGGDTEWANAGAGRWMSYVMEVVHDVDHHFATQANRQHRGLAGLSEGGYAAINISLRHLTEFSVAESWSGYFSQTASGVFAHATSAQVAANSPTAYVPLLTQRIRRLGFRAWLYQGVTDTSPPSLMIGFAHELHSAGADVRYGFFPGGHDWALWRRQLPHMLIAAGRWFSQRPGRAGLSGIGHHLSDARLRAIHAKRLRHCLHRDIHPGDHVGLGCRVYRKRHGVPTPGPGISRHSRGPTHRHPHAFEPASRTSRR